MMASGLCNQNDIRPRIDRYFRIGKVYAVAPSAAISSTARL